MNKATSLCLLLMAVFFSNLSFGQGTVRGKITDELGETVIGATVAFKNNPSVGVITDFNGEFSLKIPTSDPTTLIISYIGFEKIERTVTLQNNEIIVLNIDFKPADFGLNEVVIEGKANKAGDYYMEKIKMNAATSIDYISSESMRKIGDNQVSAAIQRIPGVSGVGNTVTVRGLADRYLITSVNGMIVPTLDPFTNNINLDIFPSGLVDNIVITKTGSPDIPEDWAGAFISIETKDFPDKFFVEFEVSVGYNTQATFQEITTSNGSSTDWLGWDNGYRDVPDGVPVNQDDFPDPITDIDNHVYDQYAHLGIQPFLNSFGITSNTPIRPGDAFSQLGLAELGFLGPALLGNEAAVQNALELYDRVYGAEYFFPLLNERISEIGQSFNSDMFTVKKVAPMNSRASFTIGNQTKLFGKTFGFIAGFRHNRVVQASSEGEINRTRQPASFDPDASLEPLAEIALDVDASQETSNLSALFSGSLKLNQNNQITALFMPNWLGENNARFGSGFSVVVNFPIQRHDQFYQERRHLIYQVHSEHYLPKISSKLNFGVSYTDGRRNEPDFRQLFYNVIDGELQFDNTSQASRAYRTMDDDLLHIKGSIEIPFNKEMRSLGKMTFGGSYLSNRRENLQTIFEIQGALGGTTITEENFANFFDRSRFSVVGRTEFDLFYDNLSTDLDRDIGFKNISAAFAMADYNVSTRLRMVGGLRVEYTDIFTDIYEYWKRDLPNDSPERILRGNVKPISSSINEFDFLPSISFIYKLKEKEEFPVNLRLNYFQTIARPSFRELSPFEADDFILQGAVKGNPLLKTTDISNFDVRLESYFPGNHHISFSTFYKHFNNHIELTELQPDIFSWVNADRSYALGFEVEGQYSILENLALRGNLSIIRSLATITVPVTVEREMFGQAPYIVNASVLHTIEKLNLNYSVSYNIQGRKIAVVTNEALSGSIFEMPRHQIDIKVGKKFGEHIGASVSVRDLLNTPVRRAYEFDRGFDLLNFDNYRWGTTYSLSITYTI